MQNGAFPAKIPPTSGRVRGAFRVSGWAVCQRAESFRSTWCFLIYKEGRQDCTAPETGGGFPGKQPETPDVQHDFVHVTSCCGNVAERPANESQVGISRFQVRKKATRNQTAERSKIETAVGQRGVQYEIRSAPVCLDKQLPRRSRYAGTCWQKPSCRPCKAFLRNAFCP